jgi:hypothetical protein
MGIREQRLLDPFGKRLNGRAVVHMGVRLCDPASQRKHSLMTRALIVSEPPMK